MREQLLALIMSQTPGILAALKALFKQRNAGAPVPTDQEILDAMVDAFTKSLAKDDAWLAAHPEWHKSVTP